MRRKKILNIFLMRKNLILKSGIILIMTVTLSCGAGRESPRAQINNFEELKELVESREFEIENEWAEPLNGNQINLIGNPNYIRFIRDSIQLYLPYFGIRHAGGNYGGRNGGIEFKGIPKNLEITEAKDNRNISIEFNARNQQEDLDFLIILFPNGRASTSVNSSERSTISYRGFLNKLPQRLRKE